MTKVKQEKGLILNKELAAVSKEFGLKPDFELILQKEFGGYLTQCVEWRKLEASLVITSEDQKEEMGEARKARLALKEMRVAIKHKHDELKAESLATGRAIDKVTNWLIDQIKPTEESFAAKENYGENLRKEREARLVAERSLALQKWEFQTAGFDLATMPEESFQAVLTSAEGAFNERKRKAEELAQQQQKAEADRIARYELGVQRSARLAFYGIKKTWEEAADMADFDTVINAAIEAKEAAEKLRAEELATAQENERKAKEQAKAQREKDEKARAEAEAKKAKLLRRVGALQFIGGHSSLSELEAMGDDDFEKLRAEKQAAWDLEKKRKAESEAETKRLKEKEAEAESQRKREAAEAKKAAKAPDKTKLEKWAKEIEVIGFERMPDVTTAEGKELLRLAKIQLRNFLATVSEGIVREFE
jgi:hypothetical protein